MELAAAFIERIASGLASFVFSSFSVFGVEIQLVVLWLFAGMVFFTLRLGFLNVRGFALGIAVLRGRYADPSAPGQMSPFQALSAALSSTVGLGNIAGVAIAIAIGGPGAAFWMIFIGFFAMSLKCAEVVLAVKYRKQHADGTVSGGPMYYLSRGLAELNMPMLGKLLGGIYAVLALFAFIQVVQVNQSWSQLSAVSGLDKDGGGALAYGLIVAGLAALVLLGGAASLGRVTSRLIPFMCLLYVSGAIVILVTNLPQVPGAAMIMIADAFSGEAAAGGLAGAFVAGMRRAVYSNEAGIGSASIAHATVRTRHAASEGFVALIEPFIDTIVICSMTALVIVVTGVWDDGHEDIAMTSAAFASVASWFPLVLAVSVCLFAFSTIIAVGYYGLQVTDYLFRHSLMARRTFLAIFCALLPVGALVDVSTVTNLIDSLFFLLCVPNLIGIYLMHNVVGREVHAFMSFAASKRD